MTNDEELRLRALELAEDHLSDHMQDGRAELVIERAKIYYEFVHTGGTNPYSKSSSGGKIG